MTRNPWWTVFLLACVSCGGPSAPEPAATPPPAAAPAPAPASPLSVKASASVQTEGDPGLKVVRAYTEQFYRGDLKKLHGKFTNEMKKTLSLDQLAALRKRVADEYGKESRVIGEDSKSTDDYRGFARWTRFDKYDGVIQVE